MKRYFRRVPFATSSGRILMAALIAIYIGNPATLLRAADDGIPAGSQRGTVEWVLEDTLVVEIHGAEYFVDMLGIDTPMSGRCNGGKAVAYLERLLPAGTVIYLERDVENSYSGGILNRWVWITNDDGRPILVNALLVRHGLAVAANWPPNDKHGGRVAKAEERAKADGAGLWGECGRFDALPGYIVPPPWNPSGDVFDCVDFPTQEAAQGQYDLDPSDPSKLDPDGNGIACEELPSYRDLPGYQNSVPSSSGGTSRGRGNDLDCEDFATQAEAQRAFEASPSDRYNLDGDGDGIACERLP